MIHSLLTNYGGASSVMKTRCGEEYKKSYSETTIPKQQATEAQHLRRVQDSRVGSRSNAHSKREESRLTSSERRRCRRKLRKNIPAHGQESEGKNTAKKERYLFSRSLKQDTNKIPQILGILRTVCIAHYEPSANYQASTPL